MVETLLYINVGLICTLILAILIKVPFGTFKKISEMIAKLEVELTSLKNLQERMENILREELRENRNELRNSFFQLREEVRTHLVNLTYLNDQKFERLRETVEEKLNFIQEENTKKLDQMREIVEEKLHSTLEKRLSESFKFVSDRLEQVYKSLGEVQALAASVGDLKRVLTNVKTKGIFGEIQLETLLEQILTPEQYVKNFPTKKGSNEKVDFAIKLPGKVDGKNWIYLPIDAKFHQADYQQLLDAYETGDHNVIEESAKKLEMKIKNSAKEIREKYLDPPYTTEFAIMFLPVEGLYAEVLRRPGLLETLHREYKVIVTGPTTLAAFLNSLQMGFRTLAIEKRASEIWELLGAVKTEFSKFGILLEKTHKKLMEASNTLEDAAKKTRVIERKLKEVQKLPQEKTIKLLNYENDENDLKI